MYFSTSPFTRGDLQSSNFCSKTPWRLVGARATCEGGVLQLKLISQIVSCFDLSLSLSSITQYVMVNVWVVISWGSCLRLASSRIRLICGRCLNVTQIVLCLTGIAQIRCDALCLEDRIKYLWALSPRVLPFCRLAYGYGWNLYV